MQEKAYKNYLLILLLVIYAFNATDGLALSLMLQNIKADLHLSDTQLGVLTGLAFAFFYSVMGIPIARWADRGNRVAIISITTALWCAAVALCAVARNFTQLLFMRMGVGVGEAGCLPPAHSLIADYFPRAQRPRAVGIYMMGAPLSVVIGYLGAGWLNELYGWRVTFKVLGLPGLAIAALAWLTLREPRTQARDSGRLMSPPPLGEVARTLWTHRTFRHLLFSYAISAFFSSGIAQWQPTFFIRSFGLKTGELGTWFAAIYGLGGLVGIYSGGALASRLAANNERLQLRAMAVMYGAFGAVSAGIYLSNGRYLAFALMGLAFVGGSATAGPLFATIQTLMPERMRATAIAVLLLAANLIGTGLGPLTVGALSDAWRSWAHEDSLRYALLALSPGYLWAGWHLWQASKTVAEDLHGLA